MRLFFPQNEKEAGQRLPRTKFGFPACRAGIPSTRQVEKYMGIFSFLLNGLLLGAHRSIPLKWLGGGGMEGGFLGLAFGVGLKLLQDDIQGEGPAVPNHLELDRIPHGVVI